MNKQYKKFLGEIPAYIAGQLDPCDREAFEAFSASHPDLQRELEDTRSAFEWLSAEFVVAGKTDFRLSPARRAALRRETDANVIAFPEIRDAGHKAARNARSRSIRRVSGWLAVAASLLFVSFITLQSGSEQEPKADEPIQVASQPEQTVLESTGVYEYIPAYGLDRPHPWRIRSAEQNRQAPTGYASLNGQTQKGVEQAEGWNYSAWQSESFGIDGPRPFYTFSTASGPGAI